MLNERSYMRWFGRPPDDYTPGTPCGNGLTLTELMRLVTLRDAIESGNYEDDLIDAVELRRLQFARWLVSRGIISDTGAGA